MKLPGRSRTSRFSGRRLIAAAGSHFEHKSCAVKLHAYTLDSSCNLASALQQNMPFPQPPRNCSVFAVQHDKGFAPANRCCATSTANRPSLSKCPNQSGLQQSLSRPMAGAARNGSAVRAIQGTVSIKQVGETGNVEATPERARLRVAQTPQAFRFDVILDAHRRAARDGRSDFTDDAALAEWAGLTVATFEGDPANMKLTTPEDFIREEARLGAMLGDIRTGNGYDVHAFGDGDHVMICGVRVPHSRGFLAHSDGDVGLHALVDAILGALADGDIGSHFPPTDPKLTGT